MGAPMTAVEVRFAGMGFVLRGLDPDTAALAHARFGAFGDVHSAVSIRVAAVAADRFPIVETKNHQETLALVHTTDAVTFAGRLCRGRVQLVDHAPSEVDVEHAPVPPQDLLGVVENSLRLATALGARAMGGVMLHSAGICRNDAAIVLVGRSGAGKSTACATALRLGDQVLSDELNIIAPMHDEWVVRPLPFAGDHGQAASERPMALRGVFLLDQGADAVKPVSVARAAGVLLASAPFVNTDRSLAGQLLEHVERMWRDIGGGALSLSLGADAWSVVTRHQRARGEAA
jgi:hypothetical protein